MLQKLEITVINAKPNTNTNNIEAVCMCQWSSLTKAVTETRNNSNKCKTTTS